MVFPRVVYTLCFSFMKWNIPISLSCIFANYLRYKISKIHKWKK
jgi:hypothetical protein